MGDREEGNERNAGESEIGDSRIVLSVFRNRDVNLVIDQDYWMYIVSNGETLPLPQNGLFKFVSLLLVTAVVAHHISTCIETAIRWVGSLIDGVFKRVYIVCQATNGLITKEETGTLLDNVKKIVSIVKKLLVILLLLLFLLDRLGVIDVTAIPKWLISI